MRATKRSSFINLLIASFLILGQILNAGDVTGRITDAGTGGYLPGANVILEGTAYGTASGRTGEYRIMNVPPDSYTLNVTYIGYEDFSAGITVSVEDVTQDVQLQATYLELGEVVVQGLRQGQVKALNQQKTAANIINVVAREQMERFPDLNIAEVLQRIPSVSITRDQGEGRFVSLRGTESRLTAVSVNGERIASPESKDRFVTLDVISANQLASIEVTKALTPDMDGDAIGGSVNLVTRSALDYDKRVLKVSGGSGYSQLMGTALFQGDFTFADRFGANKNIGLTLSGNYYNYPRGSDNNEMKWGGRKDTSGAEIDWALRDLQFRHYTVKRERFGFTSNLDWRLSDDHQLYARVMFNRRDDLEQRRRLRIRPDKGAYVDRTHILEAALERELKDRLERENIYNIVGGGQHHFGSFDLDYTLSYSYADQSKPEETDPAFELDEDADLTLDLSDPDLPTYEITNLASGYEHDAANWVLDEIVYEDKGNTESELGGAINLKYPFAFGGYTGEAKVGGKVRMKGRERDNTTWEYGWEGVDDITMDQFVVAGEDYEIFGGNPYRVGPSADSKKMRDWFKAHRDVAGELEGEINREDSDAENYQATENIFAGYGMTTLNLDKLMVLAGVRVEMTTIDYTGNDVLFDIDGDYVSTTEISSDDSYSHFLPMIHLRYQLTPQTNIRAALTSGLSRPNYYHLVPYKIILAEDEEMVIGNPDLVPTTAYNFDLLAEHYLPGIGIVSGGFFYKALSDIIYTGYHDQVGGPYAGYEVEQMVNGETASLLGFEINWQQELAFLPGPLSGLGIYANYTYTTSEADLPDRAAISLPGQAGNVGNFAIAYEKYGFLGRLSFNYHGSYIDEVGGDEEEDIYYDDHLQLDFSASYQITPMIQAYFEAINLTDAPLRYYMGSEDRPLQREFYSWWMHAGLKFEF